MTPPRPYRPGETQATLWSPVACRSKASRCSLSALRPHGCQPRRCECRRRQLRLGTAAPCAGRRPHWALPLLLLGQVPGRQCAARRSQRAARPLPLLLQLLKPLRLRVQARRLLRLAHSRMMVSELPAVRRGHARSSARPGASVLCYAAPGQQHLRRVCFHVPLTTYVQDLYAGVTH